MYKKVYGSSTRYVGKRIMEITWMPNNREILKEYRYIYIKKHNTTIININYEYIKAGNCLGDAKFKKEKDITMTN